MRRTLIVAGAIACLLAAASSRAGELGAGSYANAVAAPLSTAFRVEVKFQLFESQYVGLFEGLRLDSLDVGKTYYATAENTVDFATVVDRMTDGDLDFLCLGERFGVGGGTTCYGEQDWFNLDQVDFATFRIDTVSLFVEALKFDYPNQSGGVTASFTLVYTVYGESLLPTRPVTWGVVKERYAGERVR